MHNAPPPIVINEIFYNAPSDLDRVQWIELYNPGNQAVDVGGWSVDRGKVLAIPAGVSLPPKGYAVFALDRNAFSKAYGGAVRIAGTLRRPLKRGGERLALSDANGVVVDAVEFGDAPPWPTSADGASASLERICPSASGLSADNWTGSPLPPFPAPAGTPGRVNAAFSPVPLPVVSGLTETSLATPGKPLPVSVRVSGARPAVSLLYRSVVAGVPGPERTLPMRPTPGGAWSAAIPGQPAGTLLRYRVQVVAGSAQRFFPAATDLRPTHSAYVHAAFAPTPGAQAIVLPGGPDRVLPRPDQMEFPPAESSRPTRGRSALVYVAAQTGAATLFDHIHTVPRSNRPGSGYIIHFRKDQPLAGQTAVSLFNEGNLRWLFSEAMAYDLYRRAGNAAPRTEFVRVAIHGQPAQTLLMVERPNKAFLRRNGIAAKGNLYKVRWYGNGLVGTHEKKTNIQTDHEDLKETVALLESTRDRPDAQWEIIQKRFDVDQVATHFAVNLVLSHWDGYFNNYFAYHDFKTDHWLLFPWDHDQAWGDDGLGGTALYDLPLDYGTGVGAWMDPNSGKPGWWRPGGAFSTPLLTNPNFKKVYLAKIRAILETTFTEAACFPIFDRAAASLGADAPRFAPAVQSLKTFVTRRRAVLLGSDALK